MNDSRKPLPVPQPESDFYWQKARAHELWLRYCEACRTAYFYPRDICPTCFARDTSWIRSSGRGSLYSFSIVHRPPHPSFKEEVPYVVALVELEEGPRIPTRLIEIEPDPLKVRVGMAVEVVFDDVNDEVTLPLFRPVSRAR